MSNATVVRNASLLLLGLALVVAGGCARAGQPRRNLGELYVDALERWDNGPPPNQPPPGKALAAEAATRPANY